MQAKKTSYKKMAYSAVLLAISVILSFVESASGITSLIAFPGVRLGLCNIAVTACFYAVSKSAAFAIAAVRPLFLFLFSGNPVSLAMSMCGSLFSYFSLVITYRAYGKVISFCGVSCISALFHSIGQIAAAMLIMGDNALLWYLPLFAALSSIMGAALGLIMNMILPRLSKLAGKEIT